ncbi:MAG TPA: helicase-related protein [Polyangiaceae bacterium]
MTFPNISGTDDEGVIVAALGPTNTGKTHRAVSRMLEYPSGMIGLPLRLLAREVYDRITLALGESQVALVTGEEKRVPARPRFWVCTVEAMPSDQRVDFLAVDEIQLAGHPERGHVFTERLLEARGSKETWFMGADTMRPLVRALVPSARIQRFPRLSRLSAAGSYSLGSLPPRSAVVAFSANRLYSLAERLRARRGGTAVVLGALSPRARNAQVAMYQAGEVDYLVATDAIGMGLNLDVERIALADRRKFDGKETRLLDLAELSQVAGRAGRFHTDGAFGTLAPEPRLPPDIERRIETHRLPEQTTLVWRNHELCFDSLEDLIQSLRQRPEPGPLCPLAHADDYAALAVLAGRPEIARHAQNPEQVRLLWEVCQIPDYRQLLLDHHPNLLGELFLELSRHTRLADAWIGPRVERLCRTDGDIETLMQRIAFVRTWTYVANRDRWLSDPAEWQERTRRLEDDLSDALHRALVARFIDVRKSSSHGRPPAAADQSHPFSALQKLREGLAPASPPSEENLSYALAEAAHGAFSVSSRGRVSFEHHDVAQFVRGRVLVEPEIALAELTLAPGALGQVRRRLQAFAKDFVRDALKDLAEEPHDASAALRGLCYQLRHSLGTLDRPAAEALLRVLDERDRQALAQLGVLVGRRAVFAPALLDADTLHRRRVLTQTFYGALPPDAGSRRPVMPFDPALPASGYLALGWLVVAPFAVRVDLLEELLAGPASLRTSDALARKARLPPDQAAALARALGFGGAKRPRRRRRRRPPARERER